MAFNDYEKSTENGAPIELYKFTHNNFLYCYTNADADVTFDGQVYKTGYAVSRGDISQDQEDFTGRTTISISRRADIPKLYISYLPTTPVSLNIYRMHATDSTHAFVQVFRGKLLSCTFEGLQATLLATPATDGLKRVIPIHTYQSSCNYAVFSQTATHGTQVSHGCNADPDSFKLTATVTGTSSSGSVVTVSGTIPSSTYLVGGVIRLVTGEQRMILSQSGNTLTLEHRLANLATGTTVTLLPGCDGQETTCRNKFGNIANFSGFSRIPFNNPFTGEI